MKRISIIAALWLIATSAFSAPVPTEFAMAGMPGMTTTVSQCPAGCVPVIVTPINLVTLPAVTITGYKPDYNSVKIDFKPVTGAADYRVYDITNPKTVKYAGEIHPYNFLTPWKTLPPYARVQSTEIEWNGLEEGKPVTLVIEAVDTLGPFPPSSAYDINNFPLVAMEMGEGTQMSMIGMNSGATDDGNISINGQGPTSNAPKAIARSMPFIVKVSGKACVPSGTDAEQVLFDPVDGMSLAPGAIDPTGSLLSYVMTSALGNAFDVGLKDCDNVHSSLMVGKKHFMDVVFDGPTPVVGRAIKHNNHALMFVSPQQTFDIDGGKILHIVEIVDAHTDGRRWVGVSIAPADSPLKSWYSTNEHVNAEDEAAFFQIFGDKFNLTQFHGASTKVPGTSQNFEIYGQLYQAPNWGRRNSANGNGIDNRSRFDLFISTTHIQIFEDGVLVGDKDWPIPLPFHVIKAYWTHYLYHTGNEINEVRANTPWEVFWLNDVPYSDERHWGTFGVEVLPASASWASMAARVVMPVLVPVN